MLSYQMAHRKKGSYIFHDDRSSANTYYGRHFSFKSRFGGIKNRMMNRPKQVGDKILKMVDGDVGMNMKMNRGFNSRHNPLGFSRKKMNPQKNLRLQTSSSGWYKVTLCYGKKYGRVEILKTLQNYIQPTSLLPVNVKIEDEDLTFYVDNDETAKRILSTHLKIQMRDGWKLQVKVRSIMPSVEMNNALKVKVKLVMSTKYDSVSQNLDLSRFHASEEFVQNDLFVPLNRQNMLQAVFEIIAESVPNLRSLNLSSNNIFATEHFSLLKRHVPDLKALDLRKNKIRSLSTLNSLSGMKLEVLILDENPLCDEFQDQTTYVREVKKLFRLLRHLDGVDLPPPVDFDIEEGQNRLPKSHDSFLCSAEGEVFTRQFLKQYFNMYDNVVSRDALIEAYAENAQFSMVAFSPMSGHNLNRYISESRNLKRVNHLERRAKLLHTGKQNIVRFLNMLPKTQHYLTSFSVDLTVYTPELISMCVCGLFRESIASIDNSKSVNSHKAFSRTFVLIPYGNGFIIVNDMLTITTASPDQIKKLFQEPSVTPLSTTPQQPSSETSGSDLEDTELTRKREMVTALSLQTGMNVGWSEKCLVETNWDFNNAVYAFNEFYKVGKIPEEAFNK